MRIIAGTFRSRHLKPLKKLRIRPTSDMLRETLFNILGPGVRGARFLDLFAGTGAVGIEALSRGASDMVTVENDRGAARLIRENLALLGIEQSARISPWMLSTQSPDWNPSAAHLSNSSFSTRPTPTNATIILFCAASKNPPCLPTLAFSSPSTARHSPYPPRWAVSGNSAA